MIIRQRREPEKRKTKNAEQQNNEGEGGWIAS